MTIAPSVGRLDVKHMPKEFNDVDSQILLHMLWRYQDVFAPDLPQTIPDLAEDLAMSLDVTRDIDDQRRVEICQAWERE